ncbi:MAG: clan AA aspartic protease [Rhizobacter sp.]|nr:clan AA aspartic protease [Ferruginibacter sp.]
MKNALCNFAIHHLHLISMHKKLRFFLLLLVAAGSGYGQRSEFKSNFIYTKGQDPILNRWRLKSGCLQSLKADASNTLATNICDCYVNTLDGYFTKKEYQKFTSHGVIDLKGLTNSDLVFKARIDSCYKGSGQTILLQAQSFTEESVNSCIDNIQKNSNKTLDSNKVKNFCSCQFELIKSKKLSDKEYAAISDPNSLLFFEIMFKCGDPFGDEIAGSSKNWTANSVSDITGPPSDSIQVLNMNGMTFVKLKIGSFVQFWLFDTGASDLLISKEMEETLKADNVIKDKNYKGIKEYEMANGIIDTCRTYTIDGIRIGSYYLNNITVAASDKAKRNIVGKSLINKFSSWMLNNKNNTLILNK